MRNSQVRAQQAALQTHPPRRHPPPRLSCPFLSFLLWLLWLFFCLYCCLAHSQKMSTLGAVDRALTWAALSFLKGLAHGLNVMKALDPLASGALRLASGASCAPSAREALEATATCVGANLV